jgi:hypothetical protein
MGNGGVYGGERARGDSDFQPYDNVPDCAAGEKGGETQQFGVENDIGRREN